MHSPSAALSFLKGALDNYLSNLIEESHLSSEEVVDTILLPIVVEKLREYKAQLITKKELEKIDTTIDSLEVDSTIKQILHDYTNQIKQLM